jgi:hypothetical protein
MSFAIIGDRAIRTGADVATELRALVIALRNLQNEEGLSFAAAIDSFLAGLDEGSALAELATALKTRLAGGDTGVAALLVTLRDLEQREQALTRQVGWPAREWSLPADALPVAPFTLKLNTEAGAFFEVLADGTAPPEQLERTEPFQAVARIGLNGRLAATSVAGVDLSAAGSVGGDAGGGVRRAMSAYIGFPSHDMLAGLALASALAKLRCPTDFDDLLDALDDDRMGSLFGLVLEGDEHLGAGVDVRAALPTQYGDLGFILGGEARLSRGFTYTIAKSLTRHGVSLAAASSSRFATGLELGVSYSVGLSSVLPGAAAKLLATTQEFAEPLQRIDATASGLIDQAETWLKPGTLIRSRIREHLDGLLADVDADEGQKAQAQSLRHALAGLFGFEEGAVALEQAVDDLGNAAADLIAGLVDDSLGMLINDTTSLSERLRKALHGKLSDEVISVLKRDVIDSIIPDLDAELERLTKELDAATKRRVNEILGRDGEAGIDQLREYIEQSRSIVSGILAGISRAQTELLAAEVGWRRERARELGFDFRAEFDATSDEAKKAYRRAVLQPRRFGDLLIDGRAPPGVAVEEAAASTRLFKSQGPRWNVALIGLALGGSVAHRSDVSVLETPDGVTIATRGEIARTRSFLKETRTVSFLSALGLLEARDRGDTAATEPRQEDGTVKVLGPRAAAKIKLDFEEDDNKLHLSEAAKLLRRFVGAGLIGDEVEATFLAEIRDAIALSGDDSVAGSISIALAVPSSEVVTVLESARRRPRAFAAAPDTDIIGAATKRALAMYDPESIDEVERDIESLGQRSFKLGGMPDEGTSRSSRAAPEPGDVSHRIEVLDMLSGVDVEASLSARATRGPVVDESGPEGDDQAAMRRIRNLAAATRALRRVLEIGAEIYFDIEFPDFTNNDAHADSRRAFALLIEQKQREMSSAARPFLKTGIPTPGFIFGKAPKRTVALFAALQDITHSVTSIAPPLILTFKPEQGEAVSVVSPAVPVAGAVDK